MELSLSGVPLFESFVWAGRVFSRHVACPRMEHGCTTVLAPLSRTRNGPALRACTMKYSSTGVLQWYLLTSSYKYGLRFEVARGRRYRLRLEGLAAPCRWACSSFSEHWNHMISYQICTRICCSDGLWMHVMCNRNVCGRCAHASNMLASMADSKMQENRRN